LIALAIAAVVVLVLLAGWWLRRRRLLRAGGSGPTTDGRLADDAGPRGRLVGLSETVRDALTAQFGHSFRAKTTEELAGDERLVELLGAEGFRELMQFLDRIDRVKFAPERPAEQEADLSRELVTWEPLMTAMAARVRARPRARPRPEPVLVRPGRSV
jgi:hypothetical protein